MRLQTARRSVRVDPDAAVLVWRRDAPNDVTVRTLIPEDDPLEHLPPHTCYRGTVYEERRDDAPTRWFRLHADEETIERRPVQKPGFDDLTQDPEPIFDYVTIDDLAETLLESSLVDADSLYQYFGEDLPWHKLGLENLILREQDYLVFFLDQDLLHPFMRNSRGSELVVIGYDPDDETGFFVDHYSWFEAAEPDRPGPWTREDLMDFLGVSEKDLTSEDQYLEVGESARVQGDIALCRTQPPSDETLRSRRQDYLSGIVDDAKDDVADVLSDLNNEFSDLFHPEDRDISNLFTIDYDYLNVEVRSHGDQDDYERLRRHFDISQEDLEAFRDRLETEYLEAYEFERQYLVYDDFQDEIFEGGLFEDGMVEPLSFMLTSILHERFGETVRNVQKQHVVERVRTALDRLQEPPRPLNLQLGNHLVMIDEALLLGQEEGYHFRATSDDTTMVLIHQEHGETTIPLREGTYRVTTTPVQPVTSAEEARAWS